MAHDFRLFVPALLAWAVTAAVLQITTHAMMISAVAVVLLALLWCWVWASSRKKLVRQQTSPLRSVIVMTLSITLAIVAALTFRIGFEHDVRSQVASIASNSQSDVLWTAVITSSPTESDRNLSNGKSLHANARLTGFALNGVKKNTSVPILITAEATELAGAIIGTTITFTGSLSSAPPARSNAFVVAAENITSSSAPALLTWTHDLRASLRVSASSLDGWGGQLIPGLAVGDTSLVSDELDDAMKTSSLSHLTAVSGANCAIITGLILIAGSALRLRRSIRVGLAVVFLGLFVLLVTPEPSVVRAAVMSVLAMVSLLWARKGIGSAALAIAIVALLCLDPWQAMHFGFVLSVLATGGIILFTRPLSHQLQRVFPPWLALIIAVPIAAQVACQPAIIFLQPSLPTFGVLANVLAAPAAPIATIAGLVACITLPIWPWLGEFATWLTWFPAWWISSIARVSSSLPAAQLPWIEGWGGVLLLVLISAVLLAAFMRWRTRDDVERPHRSVRWPFIAGSLALSTLLSIAVVRPIATYASIPNDWRIFACDVGQGDAIFVRGSGGLMLIDTGIEPDRVEACVRMLGVKTIDVVVLTHDDQDHVGGLKAVSSIATVAVISPAPKESDAKMTREVTEELNHEKVVTHIGTVGMRGSLGDVQWQVLWPVQKTESSSTNDLSVTVRIDAPEMSAIFLGDLGEDAQRELMRTTTISPVDVVKVSHHGSADQSTEMYARLSATYGIISVGEENGYGHPTQSLLDTLVGVQTQALRTDLLGSIAIARSSDGTWKLWQGAAVG